MSSIIIGLVGGIMAAYLILFAPSNALDAIVFSGAILSIVICTCTGWIVKTLKENKQINN